MSDPIRLLADHNPVAEEALRDEARTPEALALRDRIMAEASPPKATGRRRPPLGSVIGGAVTVAAAGAVGLLFVFTGPQDDPAPAAAIPEGGWGMEATVSVEPSPGGLPLDEATRRAAEIIEARAVVSRMDRVSAVPIAPGLVRVTVPWAQYEEQFAPTLVGSTRVAVYDLDRVLLASSHTDPGRALRVLQGTGDVPRESGWYAVSPGGRFLRAGPVPRRGRARAGWKWIRIRADVVPVVAGAGYLVLRDRPVAGPDDVVRIERSGRQVRVELKEPRAPRRPVLVGAGHTLQPDSWFAGHPVLVGAARPSRPEFLFPTSASVDVPWLLAAAPRDASPVAARTLELRPRDSSSPFRFHVGGLDADLAVRSVRSAGTKPARQGRSAELPKWMRFVFESRPPFTPGLLLEDSTRLVASGPGRFRAWEILTTSGANFVVASARGAEASLTGPCALGPSAPLVRVCWSGTDHVLGPVSPVVGEVVVRTTGGVPVARARAVDGWFAAQIAMSRRPAVVDVTVLDHEGGDLGIFRLRSSDTGE